MDVQMPEMDGLEATRRIRHCGATVEGSDAAPEGIAPRIIAMTADVTREGRAACFAAGMDDYISKPVQVPELVAALSRAQGQSQAVVQMEKPAAARACMEDEVQAKSQPRVTSDVSTASKVLDVTVLEHLKASLGRRADKKMVTLLEAFHESAERLLGEMQQALSQGDREVLNRSAHSLKSTSASMGAMALSEIAKTLEYATKEAISDEAAALIAQAETAYAQVKGPLEALDVTLL
jgi:DNA-binding response OmpR family regulator